MFRRAPYQVSLSTTVKNLRYCAFDNYPISCVIAPLDYLPCSSEVDDVARLNVGFVAFLIDVNRTDRPAL
jgi:hypothetical protein